jgi:hypothetical protein
MAVNKRYVRIFMGTLFILMSASLIAKSDNPADIPTKGRSPQRQFTESGAITREMTDRRVSMPGAIITSFGRDTTVGVIPESIDGYKVTGIADNAFSCCTGLTEITIPESMEAIGSSAFACCQNLSLIVINARTPPRLGLTPFHKNDLTIKVPNSDGHTVLNTYRAAPVWKDFAENIVEQD